MSSTSKASFHWDDPLLLEQQLGGDERQVRDAAHAYCQERLAPRVLDAFRPAKTDPAIFRGIGERGLLRAPISEQDGGPRLDYRLHRRLGLAVQCGGSGYRSTTSVPES